MKKGKDKDKDRVNLREYSVSRFKDVVRKHLRSYNMRIYRDLTDAERRKIEKLVADVDPRMRDGYRQQLQYAAATIVELAVLGLDKAEAIGRATSWFGGKVAKGDYRLEVNDRRNVASEPAQEKQQHNQVSKPQHNT